MTDFEGHLRMKGYAREAAIAAAVEDAARD